MGILDKYMKSGGVSLDKYMKPDAETYTPPTIKAQLAPAPKVPTQQDVTNAWAQGAKNSRAEAENKAVKAADPLMLGINKGLQSIATTALKSPLSPFNPEPSPVMKALRIGYPAFMPSPSKIYSSLTGRDFADDVLAVNPAAQNIAAIQPRVDKAKQTSGKGFGAYSDIAEAVGGAIPQAIIALMSAPAAGTDAVQRLSAGAATKLTALTEPIRQSITKITSVPNFTLAYAQSFGNDYDTAKKSGADEDKAIVAASISGLINAAIEQGGIQELPTALKGKSSGAISAWVKSMLDEGKEEVLQGVVSNLAAKTVYQPESPVFSTTDDSAVINPNRAAQEFIGGAAVGGLLGGSMALTLNMLTGSSNPSVAQQASDIQTRLNSPDETIATQAQTEAVTFLNDVSKMQDIVSEIESRLSSMPQTPDTVNAADILNRRRQIMQRDYATARESLSRMEAENEVIRLASDYITSDTVRRMEQTGTMTQEVNALKRAYNKAFQIQQRINWLIQNNDNPREISDAERSLTVAAKDLTMAQNRVANYLGNDKTSTVSLTKYLKPEYQTPDTVLNTDSNTIPSVQGVQPPTAPLAAPQAPKVAPISQVGRGTGTQAQTVTQGAQITTDGLGAADAGALGGLGSTKKTAFPVNDAMDVDLNNLPAMSNQVNLQPQPKTGNFRTALSNAYTQTVDSLNPIVKFSQAANDNTSMLASNSKNAGGTVAHIYDNALVDMEGNTVGKSLAEVVRQIPQDQQTEFWNYMLQRHNINRAVSDKNVIANFNSKMSQRFVNNTEAQNPRWKQIGDDIVGWIDTFNQTWGVGSGIIDAEIYNNLRTQYPSYIPTQREFTEVEQALTGRGAGQKFVDNTTTLKTATGSARDINNPVENIMRLVNTTVKTARYNQVGQSLVNSIRANPQLSQYAEIVSEAEAKKSSASNIVTVMENGKDIYVRINDKALLESLEGLPKSTRAIPVASQLVQGFKSLVTQKNPLFGARNLARDIPTGYIYGSEANPFKYIGGEVGAFRDIAKNTPNYQRFKAVGGGMANFISSAKMDQNALEIVKNPSRLKKIGLALEKFNSAIEEATRLNEFNTVFEKTGDVQKALDASNNVTVNFARGGNITKTVDKNFVPYLNASIQGLDRLAKSVKTPRALAMTFAKAGLSVALPTLLIHLLNRENPHYDELSNRTRDAYYVIPNYLGSKDDQGYPETFIKIPRSREFGALFGALFDRILRSIDGEENAYKGIGNTIATSFAPTNPIENNILAPISNLKANKDFANRTIVPNALQGLSPSLQFDEKTSEITKFIAKYAAETGVELSPKQMDYLIDAYTGVIGDILLPATTKGGDPLSPVKSAFTADSAYSNQTLTDFYDNMKKAATLAADRNFLEDIDPAVQTLEEKISSSYSKSSKEISALSKIAARAENLTADDVKALSEYGIDTALKPEDIQREIRKAQAEIAGEALKRADRANVQELDIFNNKNTADAVKKYMSQGVVSETEAYGIYKALGDAETANGKDVDLKDSERVDIILNQRLSQQQKAYAVASLEVGNSFTYTPPKPAMSTAFTPKPQPQKIIMTEAEKKVYKDTYAKTFSQSYKDTYDTDAISKVRELARKAAQMAVVQSRA